MPDDLDESSAGFHDVWRQPVHRHIPVVTNDEAACDVEQNHALGHVVQGDLEKAALVVQQTAGEGGSQAHCQDGHRDARDSDGKRIRRQRKSRESARRIGDDFDCPHGGEMMRDDSGRQEQCRCQQRAWSVPTHGHGERSHSQDHSQDDRRDDHRNVPFHPAGKLKRPHAEIMHAGNPGADDATANRRGPSDWKHDCSGQSGRGDGRRGNE